MSEQKSAGKVNGTADTSAVGYATSEGTSNYADRFKDTSGTHFRKVHDLQLSSIGLGTYMGNPTIEMDEQYTDSVVACVQSGCNVIDTAINYRLQRSERSIGRGLKSLSDLGYSRASIFISTKGGFIPFDESVPDSPTEYFTKTFMEPGIAQPKDIVAGMHCMTPKYLSHQLDRSLENLGVDTVDLYYIHNPETQRQSVDETEFYNLIRHAFEALETAVTAGKTRIYGCATWDAFRVGPDNPSHISMEKLVDIAVEVAGAGHHFRAVQMPFNLGMPEALTVTSQPTDSGGFLPALHVAHTLGLSVFTSVPVLQGKFANVDFPEDFVKKMKQTRTSAQRAIQFVRSTPEIVCPLVGMSSLEHVKENLELFSIDPLSYDEYSGLFESVNG